MHVSGESYALPKYLQIVEAIRQGVADGTYPPGSRLPSETQLIEQFGFSRPTTVRALQVLELSGVISREHGRGSFVQGADPKRTDPAPPPSGRLPAPGGMCGCQEQLAALEERVARLEKRSG